MTYEDLQLSHMTAEPLARELFPAYRDRVNVSLRVIMRELQGTMRGGDLFSIRKELLSRLKAEFPSINVVELELTEHAVAVSNGTVDDD